MTVMDFPERVERDRREQSYRDRRKGTASWLKSCILGTTGKPLPILSNATRALRHDPALRGCFAYDEMDCRPKLIAPLPGQVDFIEQCSVTDTHVILLQEHLQEAGLARIGKDVVHDAIDLYASERRFHPVRDYIESLVWDEKPRVNQWTCTYLGTELSNYTSAIGRMFLIQMMARVYEPGCKADHMPILEGPQGAMKSTACSILGGRWYSDHMPDIGEGKDASQHLRGKWVIEVPEMSAMSKPDTARLKAFITRPTERYRPSYGRREVEEPRQCCFIGTTNKEAYLKDETGGRRFWPLKVNEIDINGLIEDRDQLFAEAFRYYQHGTPWWPEAEFEQKYIAPQQEARYDADAWEETIRSWLAGQDKVLIGDVARGPLGLETARIGRADQNRISAILERLGWRRMPKDSKGNIPWAKGDR